MGKPLIGGFPGPESSDGIREKYSLRSIQTATSGLQAVRVALEKGTNHDPSQKALSHRTDSGSEELLKGNPGLRGLQVGRDTTLGVGTLGGLVCGGGTLPIPSVFNLRKRRACQPVEWPF